MNMKRIKKEKIRIHRHYQPVNYFGKGGSRFFSDSKVRPLRGFWENHPRRRLRYFPENLALPEAAADKPL